jgi:predicted HTH domain antitoxin
MTLTLPGESALRELSDTELRIELACARYARGNISAVGGSHLAGMDLVEFQGALVERGIPRNYSVADLHDDLAALLASANFRASADLVSEVLHVTGEVS